VAPSTTPYAFAPRTPASVVLTDGVSIRTKSRLSGYSLGGCHRMKEPGPRPLNFNRALYWALIAKVQMARVITTRAATQDRDRREWKTEP
jgi:hypothetical protein